MSQVNNNNEYRGEIPPAKRLHQDLEVAPPTLEFPGPVILPTLDDLMGRLTTTYLSATDRKVHVALFKQLNISIISEARLKKLVDSGFSSQNLLHIASIMEEWTPEQRNQFMLVLDAFADKLRPVAQELRAPFISEALESFDNATNWYPFYRLETTLSCLSHEFAILNQIPEERIRAFLKAARLVKELTDYPSEISTMSIVSLTARIEELGPQSVENISLLLKGNTHMGLWLTLTMYSDDNNVNPDALIPLLQHFNGTGQSLFHIFTALYVSQAAHFSLPHAPGWIRTTLNISQLMEGVVNSEEMLRLIPLLRAENQIFLSRAVESGRSSEEKLFIFQYLIKLSLTNDQAIDKAINALLKLLQGIPPEKIKQSNIINMPIADLIDLSTSTNGLKTPAKYAALLYVPLIPKERRAEAITLISQLMEGYDFEMDSLPGHIQATSQLLGMLACAVRGTTTENRLTIFDRLNNQTKHTPALYNDLVTLVNGGDQPLKEALNAIINSTRLEHAITYGLQGRENAHRTFLIKHSNYDIKKLVNWVNAARTDELEKMEKELEALSPNAILDIDEIVNNQSLFASYLSSVAKHRKLPFRFYSTLVEGVTTVEELISIFFNVADQSYLHAEPFLKGPATAAEKASILSTFLTLPLIFHATFLPIARKLLDGVTAGGQKAQLLNLILSAMAQHPNFFTRSEDYLQGIVDGNAKIKIITNLMQFFSYNFSEEKQSQAQKLMQVLDNGFQRAYVLAFLCGEKIRDEDWQSPFVLNQLMFLITSGWDSTNDTNIVLK